MFSFANAEQRDTITLYKSKKVAFFFSASKKKKIFALLWVVCSVLPHVSTQSHNQQLTWYFTATGPGEVPRAEKASLTVFIDLTIAFDSGLFKLLQMIMYSSRLLIINFIFHKDIQSAISFDGATSEAFPVVWSRAPVGFDAIWDFVLNATSVLFQWINEVVCFYTRIDCKLFNIARLHAKMKVRLFLVRKFLFADDAALVALFVQHLQKLVVRLSCACKEFGFTIRLRRPKSWPMQKSEIPVITIDDTLLEVVPTFIYLGFTVYNAPWFRTR